MNRDLDALHKEATAWIVRLTSGHATGSDADALKRWRATSPGHEQAFQQAALTWRTLGPVLEEQRSSPVFTRRRLLATGGAAAASSGLALGLAQIGILPSFDMLFADYSTEIGKQQTFHLPDGSIATLDGGSALSLTFSSTDRAATLSAGAAVFDVTPDTSRPFRLTASYGETITSDASFSVGLGSDDTSIECLRGRVQVNCHGREDIRSEEAITYSAEGLGQKTTTDPQTTAAWRKGLLVFKDRTIADVISDLNRHRRGTILIANSSLRKRRVSGVFHLDRPEEILAHLETTMQVRPIDLPGGVMLLI